jgi:hypothetical protein
MKCLTGLIAMVILGLGLAAQADAQQLPSPRYVKKAVFVRAHWDNSFYQYYASKGLNATTMDALIRSYFDQVRAAYLLGPMQNIDLILLEDFKRAEGPMATYHDTAPQRGGHTRLVDAMRTRLRTATVSKTVPNGTTHLVGRTINWVFVYGNYGDQQGFVDTIGNLAGSDANMFISMSGGDLTRGGVYYPLKEQLGSVVMETLLHETGHIFGGQHGTNNELADCPKDRFEIMCQGSKLQRRFGSQNALRVTNVIKPALARCNSAFSTVNACENAVSNMCSAILDYRQIQPCIDSNIVANCRDICTPASKNARVVINSLPGTITNDPTVVAAGPKQ